MFQLSVYNESIHITSVIILPMSAFWFVNTRLLEKINVFQIE